LPNDTTRHNRNGFEAAARKMTIMNDSDYDTKTKQSYYLWHLAALGVLSVDGASDTIRDTLWDRLAAAGVVVPSTVVMIDVGCSFDHPNLRGRLDEAASIDFTAGAQGQRLAKHITGHNSASNFNRLNIEPLWLDGLNTQDVMLFEEVVQHLKATCGQTRTAGDVEARFASHGTSVAGLIVGGPEIQQDAKSAHSPGVIPYFGVDPFSRLISVRTGFDDDPLQFIAALLYAWTKAPDVIVMPRGLPDPTEGAVSFKDDLKADLESWSSSEAADILHRIDTLKNTTASPLDTQSPQHGPTQARLWLVVKALFVAISKHIPIVCAAGNAGESQLLYPAKLATGENGIIAVGAIAGSGYRSAYANYGDWLTLVAPSDDMTVFNRDQLRDTPETAAKRAPLRSADTQVVPFSPLGLLSTDIGGVFGYDAGHDTETKTPQSGFYTQFGGTSGAAALVAGVIALVRRAERLESKTEVMDGTDIRALLISTARKTLPGLGTPLPLRTDCINASTEDAESFKFFFGAGLIDARAALGNVLG
jgi:subtilisin family serine protease